MAAEVFNRPKLGRKTDMVPFASVEPLLKHIALKMGTTENDVIKTIGYTPAIGEWRTKGQLRRTILYALKGLAAEFELPQVPRAAAPPPFTPVELQEILGHVAGGSPKLAAKVARMFADAVELQS